MGLEKGGASRRPWWGGSAPWRNTLCLARAEKSLDKVLILGISFRKVLATFTVTIWENEGVTRGGRKAIANLSCPELGEELSKFLVGPVQENGLLQGDCLLAVENDETGERAFFPPAPPPSGEDPTKRVPELLGEKRFMEALQLAEMAAKARPEEPKAHLLKAYVLKSIGSLEWRRQLFSCLEQALERAEGDLRKEIKRRLKKAKLAKYLPAKNPRVQLVQELFEQLEQAEPDPLAMEDIEKKALDLVSEIALPFAEIEKILVEFGAFQEQEPAVAALTVWYQFYLKDPESASKADLKLLKKKRKRVRPTLVKFFTGVGPEWAQAISEFYEVTKWCPPGAEVHLNEEQLAHFKSQQKGCFSSAAAIMLFFSQWPTELPFG